jgi:hypothetical protein
MRNTNAVELHSQCIHWSVDQLVNNAMFKHKAKTFAAAIHLDYNFVQDREPAFKQYNCARRFPNDLTDCDVANVF